MVEVLTHDSVFSFYIKLSYVYVVEISRRRGLLTLPHFETLDTLASVKRSSVSLVHFHFLHKNFNTEQFLIIRFFFFLECKRRNGPHLNNFQSHTKCQKIKYIICLKLNGGSLSILFLAPVIEKVNVRNIQSFCESTKMQILLCKINAGTDENNVNNY